MGGDEHVGSVQQVSLPLVGKGTQLPAAIGQAHVSCARDGHVKVWMARPDQRQGVKENRQPFARLVRAAEKGQTGAGPAPPATRKPKPLRMFRKISEVEAVGNHRRVSAQVLPYDSP